MFGDVVEPAAYCGNREGSHGAIHPASGAPAGYDGAKRRKGAKVHAAVDPLGHLLTLRVSPADEQDRAQVGALARQV